MFLHCVSPKYILERFVVTVTLGHRIWEMLQFGKGLRWELWRFADRAGILSTFLDFKEIMPLLTTMLQEYLPTFGSRQERFGAAEVVRKLPHSTTSPPFIALKTWSHSGRKLPFTGSVT